MTDLARSASQLGAIVKRRRRLKQLTQTQLAAHIGARQATISGLEAGAAGTRLSTLLEVLAALELELIVQPRSKGSAQAVEDIF